MVSDQHFITFWVWLTYEYACCDGLCVCVCAFVIVHEHACSGVGDLTCMTGPSVYLHCIGFSPGLLASIRRHLKKYNFSNFSGLLESLEKIDKAQQQVSMLSFSETCS